MILHALRLRAFATLIVLAVVALAAAAACGDDDNGASSTAAQTGPSTITVTSTAINGQQGKQLLVYLAGTTGGPIAEACAGITSNSFTLTPVVMTDSAPDRAPCSGQAKQTVLAPGTYTVTAGVYLPPGKDPEKQLGQIVEVKANAPLKLTIDGAALSK